MGVSGGRGPWSRLLVGALVDDADSILAERGRALADEGRVHDLSVEAGEISAGVTGTGGRELAVTLTARPVPARIWASVVEGAEEDTRLEAAVAGREQSVHLQHGMAADWGEPLVPRGRSIQATCNCSQSGHRCQHLAAVAYVAAAAIDADPSLLLRWRGCEPVSADRPFRPQDAAPHEEEALADDDSYTAGPLPEPVAPRPLPAAAVLMRLAPSGINVGGHDLAEELRRAYECFSAT